MFAWCSRKGQIPPVFRPSGWVKPLLMMKGGRRDSNPRPPGPQPRQAGKWEITWEWRNASWSAANRLPKRDRGTLIGQWEWPAFPTSPIHSPDDVRAPFAVGSEINVCSECGATTIQTPEGWRCDRCGVSF